MLSKISREPRELPRQPNLDKSKPKLHKVHFCARNRGIFRKYSGAYSVGEFKYSSLIHLVR